jgi:hypothetical protein
MRRGIGNQDTTREILLLAICLDEQQIWNLRGFKNSQILRRGMTSIGKRLRLGGASAAQGGPCERQRPVRLPRRFDWNGYGRHGELLQEQKTEDEKVGFGFESEFDLVML